ncbi:MAG: hypothetical protein Q9179_000796 [Wetmoreana sp. 5 TL-2023]
MAGTSRQFHHPFEPYEIQSQLMNAVYDCISDGKVGIFESPTGTGKSLSLICSTVSWLRDEQSKLFKNEASLGGDVEEPAWIVEQAQRQRTEMLIRQRTDLEFRLAKIRDKESCQRRQYEKGEPAMKRAKLNQGPKIDEERQFVLDDYESDDENGRSAVERSRDESLSAATLDLMQKLGEPLEPIKGDSDPELPDELKVFFCSRTHSQLTQFVNELRRVKIVRAAWLETEKDSPPENEPQHNVVKHLPLGSRRNLCINPEVVSAGSTAAINERCLDLQQPSTPQEQKCPFLPNKENQALVNEFRDNTLARVRDIEDLATLGKQIGICPYYSARTSIKPSEVVTLPYPLLLQKSAREALGISLKGHIVVIDEAHNLMDAISSIHSIAVTQSQLHRCQTQLRVYLQKFRNKLKGKNRVYVTQAARLIDSVSECLDKLTSEQKVSEALVEASDLMGGKGVDQINLNKLIRYLTDSKLARKVESYVEYTETTRSGSLQPHVDATPALTHVQGFLQTLMNPAAEGRFFFEKGEEVVEDARAVILAGGTMSPMEDYVRYLFAYVAPERLATWSCGHIIPKDNLFVRAMSNAPDGMDLDFSFAKRTSAPLINALGRCLVRLAATVPDGLVVFFPSYAYLDQVSAQWHNVSTGSDSIWASLEKYKAVFKEAKGSSGIEDALTQYSKAIDEGKGGLLLSVVGGKMSEGINFSDKLGRGVIVVGLPFPNIHSAQWKAKLEYIERSTLARGKSGAEGKAAGREFYENACIRAVNQSIGRAIRHRNDFASILLLDRRYSTPRITNKLPGWIKEGLSEEGTTATFSDIFQGLQNFFKQKN